VVRIRISESLILIKHEFTDKIIIDEDIENQPKGNRGIYGLFIIENDFKECAYIGKSEIISSRIANHLYKIIDGNHAVIKLNKAFLDKESKILCEFVEPVEYRFDNYYKDAQRLASRECYWIDKYQEINQCIEQVPEGRRPDKNWWNKQAKK
jgi:hypothetical protein